MVDAETTVMPAAQPLPQPVAKPAGHDRWERWRVAVFLVALIILLGFGHSLLSKGFGATPQVSKYSELEMAALSRMEAVCEKTFALATAMIGALGAALLGLSKGPSLRGPRAWAVALSVAFAVTSAMSGLIARYKMIEIVANAMPSTKLMHGAVQAPLGAQLLFLFLSVAAIGWYAIDDAMRPAA
jgi:hypothetical protein